MRKGQVGINALPAIAIAFVVAAIVFAVGLQITGETQDDFVDDSILCNSVNTTGCGAAYNATGDGIDGLAKVPAKFPLIGTVIAAVVVLGLVIGGLAFGRRR